MKDIVAWAYHSTPLPDVADADLHFSAGTTAALWLCDRFVHTALDDWRKSSLDWELRYAHQPVSVANEIDVPLSVLEQRPTHRDMVVDALVRRVTKPGAADPVVAGLTRADLRQQAILLIGDGHLGFAQALLREAVRCYPDDGELRNMLGFWLIPIEPEEALHHFDACRGTRAVPLDLLIVNQAAALIRLGRVDEALVLIEPLASAVARGERGSSAVLWPCKQIVEPAPVAQRLESVYTADWAAQMITELQ